MKTTVNRTWTKYRKSSRSDGSGQCVEVGFSNDDAVRVRDTKLGQTSPVLEFPGEQWRAFLRGDASSVGVKTLSDGAVEMRNVTLHAGPALVFTKPEWDAFNHGVAASEFEPRMPAAV